MELKYQPARIKESMRKRISKYEEKKLIHVMQPFFPFYIPTVAYTTCISFAFLVLGLFDFQIQTPTKSEFNYPILDIKSKFVH